MKRSNVRKTFKAKVLKLISEAEKRWNNPYAYEDGHDIAQESMEDFRDLLINILNGKDEYGAPIKPLPTQKQIDKANREWFAKIKKELFDGVFEKK